MCGTALGTWAGIDSRRSWRHGSSSTTLPSQLDNTAPAAPLLLSHCGGAQAIFRKLRPASRTGNEGDEIIGGGRNPGPIPERIGGGQVKLLWKGAYQCVAVGLYDFADLGNTEVDLLLQNQTHGLNAILSERRLLQHLILDAQRLDDLHEMRSHGGTPGRVGKGDAVGRQQRRLQFFRRGNIRFRGSWGGGKTGNRITQTIGDSV